MDFEAEFAAELEQDGPKAAQADDDLEAELSALLGKTSLQPSTIKPLGEPRKLYSPPPAWLARTSSST
jgi:hypothetical protein